MGYGLMLYGVSPGALKLYFGSRDARTLERFCQRYARDLESLDDFVFPGMPNAREAAAQLINGDPLHPSAGHLYGYLFKYFCDSVGRFLDNRAVMPCPASFLDEHVEPALREMGVSSAFSFSRLLYGGDVPFAKLPRPDDFPMYSYLPPEEVKRAAEALRHARYTGMRHDVSEIVESAREWFTTCASLDWGLASFYH
jgi:AcrR family transcriptional regulator